MYLWDEREIVIKGNGSIAAPDADRYALRQSMMQALATDDAEVTIMIPCHNRPDKLKNCVESIFRYTKDVRFHLLFVDSGINSDMLAYIRSINYPQLRILHLDGAPCVTSYKSFLSPHLVNTPYFAGVSEDIIVTENWLPNLLRCVKEDPSVGMAVPMATNISNLQQVDFEISDLNELAVRAKLFNKSDPKKWRQRMRLIDAISLIPTGMFCTTGTYDFAYRFNFSEDDLCYRIRAAGYKLMLCGDTFVHHDRDFRAMEDHDETEFERTIQQGRALYQRKHHGLDAWDDVNNYETALLSTFRAQQNAQGPRILGMDCRMGTPILEVKNAYRAVGVFDAECHAFTTQAKYFADLQTICDTNVICDREAFFTQHYKPESFDVIVLGKPLNAYERPYHLLDSLFTLLQKGGQLLFRLSNTQSALMLCKTMGRPLNVNMSDALMDIGIDDLARRLDTLGASDVRLAKEKYTVEPAFQSSMRSIVSAFHPCDAAKIDEQMEKMTTSEYCICIEK